MRALKKNDTWELVPMPKGVNPMGCRWVYNLKYNADGSLERYKARLVAKGYTQTYGIDYLETFAPIAKMTMVRILLSLADFYGWQLYQLDVKNAFLHGDLEEEVFMEQPLGFKEGHKGEVCKLKKALYGLKQSPRAWFDRFSKAIKLMGYQQSRGDHTLFFKHSKEGKLTVLLVYVDDIIVTGSNLEEQQALKGNLAQNFEIKDLESLKYFLGIEVAYSKEGIFLSQRKYILDLLKETGLLGGKGVCTPVEPNARLSEDNDSPPVDRGRYQRLVGRLIYLSHTRPDITYSVSLVSQFMHCPTESHMQAVRRILCYLKTTPGKRVIFKIGGDSLEVQGYTDVDYAGLRMDRRSTTDYCMFLGEKLIS